MAPKYKMKKKDATNLILSLASIQRNIEIFLEMSWKKVKTP
jgi:hypothetical protein